MRPPAVLHRVGMGLLAVALALNSVVPVLAAPPTTPPSAPAALADATPAAVGATTALAGATSIRATPNVTATVGAGGTYLTLKAAFDAINNGDLTGAIQLDIVGDTNELTATAVLSASGTGLASYTSVLIQPAGGGARLITGTTTAGSPMIDLNGADNVTINGLNTDGNSLTIANATASATSGTSTFRFIGGATNNTLTNLTILGAGAMSVATNGATIFFSTDAVTANGNDNNTISNNNIGPVSQTALPTKAILGNGSATTTAIGNSGILITNNNIYDFFGAAVTSSGIATNGGSNTWTITNNRFYQTAPRTWTTGANHRAIDINNTTATSGAQGFTITGNIIGYASNTQTGTYALTGSTGKFIGIQFNGITAGTLSTIHNNTIASVSLTGGTSSGTSTSSPFMGILVTNGVANTNNNTLGSQSVLNSLVFSTTSTSATDIIGIYNFSVDNWTATGNTLGGLTVTNTAASGTYVVYGLRANTSTGVSFNGNLNMVGGTVANSIQLNATGTSSQIIGMHTANAQANFISNTVRNLTTNFGTGTTTAASIIGINVTTSTPNHTLSQNTIYNLSNTNPLSASVVTGIQFTGGTANVVERNFIYGLTAATTSATAEVNGIRVAGGTTIYRNNMIALGAGIANALGGVATNSSTTGINGINEALGTNQFFHNSVYIGGTATAGSGSSFAFNGTQTVNTRSFRDNIFFNARTNSGATGKHYAIKINGTTPNPTGLTLNNNLYFANGTGAVFGFFNSLDVANLAAWKTAVGQDANSFEANPQYNDPTNAVPDLHLHPTNLTPAEGNGLDVGVANDFDGQTRASLTPTDIGADAGNFSGLDLAGPGIAYTPLGNTSLTTNRLLVANIVDVTGVPTTGSLQPRLYYNKNGGAWFSAQGTLASGTGQNGSWNFTLNVSDVGGVVVGDVISYYVIAQDTAPTPNLASHPAGATATDVNTVSTPPAVPFTYTIVSAFSGSYNVGATEVYTSLTNAGGIFQAINAGALTGNVVINVTSHLTGETGLHALNQWAEDGTGGYTLLIRPTGTFSVTGSNAGALIKFNGTDRLTLDGSTSGGTDRSLTIQNTNTGTSAVVVALQSGVSGAQNNTLKNVNILGQDPTTTLLGISVGGNTPGTVGTDNDGNRVENNAVRRAIFGIYNAGQSAANPNLGTVIVRNDLTGVGLERIRRAGILVFNEDGIQITDNVVANLETNESADAIGIGVGTQSINDTLTTSGGVVNAFVARNRINGVNHTSTTGFSAVGIAVAGGSGPANRIVNNTVTSITAPATSPDLVAGIFVAGVTGADTHLYFNSVNLWGDRGTVATQMPAFALAVTGANPTLTLKDNIFQTTQTSGGGTGAKSYAIGLASTTFTNLDSDYNLFHAAGANAGFFRTGSLNIGVGTDYATLAAWQTAVSDDANSRFGDAAFISNIDLHLQPTSPALGAGTPIAGVMADIDGDPRHPANPSIGADEGPMVVPVTFVYNDLEDAVSAGDNVFVDGLLGFGNPLLLTADGGATTFSTTLPLTRNTTYQYKYVVNTFDGYGYDLLNNPGTNRVITLTAGGVRQDYRRIWQYDYFAMLGPASASIYLGDPSPVISGETFINNLTPPAGIVPGLRAQVGYGNTPTLASWTWTDIPFNAAAVSGGNNDGFSGVFTPTAVGVYSYAVRFNANWGAANPNNLWVYGGLGFAPLAPDLSNAGVITVSPPSASIAVVKTVGLPGAGCAGTDWLVVGPNTEVEYCFTVQNTGQVTLTTHSVTDTVVGPLLNNFAYTLVPGASVSITAPYTHSTPGLNPNTVTWNATDGVDTAFSTDTANVFVAVPGVALTKTVSTGTCATAADVVTATLGAVVNYCFTVQNTGNYTLTNHTLSDPWLGTTLNMTLTLAPGASAGPITVPYTTTAAGTFLNTATFTGTNGVFSASDDDTATLYVINPTIAVSPASLTSTQAANTQVTQTLTISNVGTLGNLNWQVAAGGNLAEGFDSVSALWANGWFSKNNSSPLGTATWFQGNGTVFVAQSGVISNSYVGVNFNSGAGVSTLSNWLLTPPLNLVNGAQFTFWTRVPSPVNFPDRLQVRLSTNGASTNVGTTATDVGDFATLLLDINPTLTTSGYPSAWTAYTVTISGLSAPTLGRLAYRYFVTNGGPSGANSSYIGIDTFAYTSLCNLPAWATVTPASGTIAAGNSQAVNVNFNSTGLAAGTYTGTLCLANNSVNNPVRTVPLTLTVAQAYGVALTPASTAQNANPGATVTYTLRLTNTGNGPDTFNIGLTNLWPTIVNSTTVGPLNAGQSVTLQVQVTIPANAAAGAMDMAHVTATSQGNGSQSAMSMLTTTANQIYGVTQTPATGAQGGAPGAVLTYTLRVTNTGNGSDSFNINLSGNTWPTLANPTTTGLLAAGAGADVQIQVTIPATATSGSSSVVNVTATSQGNGLASASSVLTTTASQTFGVNLNPATQAQSAILGQVVTYTLTLTNTGTGSDSFNITITGTTWTTTANPTTVGPVAAGASATFNIVVTVPLTATQNASSTATIRATSVGSGTTFASATVTTTALWYRNFLPIIYK